MVFINEGYSGMLDMKGKKTFLGVPKNKISSKSDMSCIDKATKRGENTAKLGKE